MTALVRKFQFYIFGANSLAEIESYLSFYIKYLFQKPD
jgi:hypothetical protein